MIKATLMGQRLVAVFVLGCVLANFPVLSIFNDDGAWLTLAVFNVHRLAVAHLHLLQQGQRIVVVDETHRLARVQRIERAEDGRMAEALGNAAGVEGVDGVGRGVDVGVHGRSQ